MNFKNKVVVITGASSGIGKAAAVKFAKKHAKVVLVARRKEKLLQVEKEISQYTDSTLVCQCDVSSKSQVKEMSDTVLDTFCLLYTSPSPRDYAASRMPSSA